MFWTSTGTALSNKLPAFVPSWPKRLLPHDHTEPSLSSASVKLAPAEMAVITASSFCTGWGITACRGVGSHSTGPTSILHSNGPCCPVPSCPCSLLPHAHKTVPPPERAKFELPPEAIASTSVRGSVLSPTSTGAGEPVPSIVVSYLSLVLL